MSWLHWCIATYELFDLTRWQAEIHEAAKMSCFHNSDMFVSFMAVWNSATSEATFSVWRLKSCTVKHSFLFDPLNSLSSCLFSSSEISLLILTVQAVGVGHEYVCALYYKCFYMCVCVLQTTHLYELHWQLHKPYCHTGYRAYWNTAKSVLGQ